MKRLFIWMVLCCFGTLTAQTTLTFTGKDNLDNYVQLHHVVVENLTQNWADTLYYPDTILILSGAGLNDYENVSAFSLSQNVPNPFDGVTDFNMTMPYDDHVVITVTDMSGRKVTEKSVRLHAGTHTFRIWLNTPQSYLLTVKTSRDGASIKMVNNGNAGHNHIEYLNAGPLTYTLKRTMSGEHPYVPGDLMRYTGIILNDNTPYYSDTIEQELYGDETIELVFHLWEHTTVDGHFVNTDTLFIPDGMACNNTCLGTIDFMVSGYPSGKTIQSEETIRYIRLKMEHSYVGDLWISLTCPNGQSAAILRKHNSGGSNNCTSLIPSDDWGWQTNDSPVLRFGQYYKPDGYDPCNLGLNPIGICWNYCWSNNVSEGYQYACSNALVYESCSRIYANNPSPNGLSNNSYADSTDVANMTNVYHPDQSFASLIGCPMNGLWQIKIIDGWSQDNGYIVEAELAFPSDSADVQVSIPTVITGNATSIGYYSATCSGTVLYDGLQTVTERGICWDTEPNPTTASLHTVEGQGMGTFSSNLTNLTAGTIYYYRAYATNASGTAYGENSSFSTVAYTLPYVNTSNVTNILDTSAVSGGTVSNNGGTPILEQGLCWSETQTTPTLADSHVAAGTNTSPFTCTMGGLVSGHTYHVRAYATNQVGTAYGNMRTFTTISLPDGITANYTYVSNTEADVTGSITDDGGNNITERGFCWSTTPSPTLQNNHTVVSETSTGSFSSRISGLVPGTTYYLNAFATNNAGTNYSADVTFTTTSKPFVTTATAHDFTNSSATVGGTVVYDGGIPVTERGICWGTQPEPSLDDQFAPIGAGLGDFTYMLTDLEPNTLYYVRTYATNAIATAYGNTVTFVTDDNEFFCGVSTVRDYDENRYHTLALGTQCWMKENMRSTHYADGTLIPLGTNVSATTSIRCYPNGNPINVAQYGYLYSWYAAMHGNPPANNQGICPDGWHVPSYDEWNVLFNYVRSKPPYYCNNQSDHFAKALAADYAWQSYDGFCSIGNGVSNNNATDFSMLPAGEYNTFDSYEAFGIESAFLNSTLEGNNFLVISLSKFDSYYVPTLTPIQYYMTSVRCLRDLPLNMTSLVAITDAAGSITTNSAVIPYSISVYDADTVITNGICWGTEPSPSLVDNIIYSESLNAGDHSIQVNDLASNTVYYVRAFATNNSGTVYGRQRVFRTLDPANAGSANPSPILPIVKTVQIANAFNGSSANCDGNVLFDGYSTITQRGICWGITPNPTISGMHVACGTGTGLFMGELNSLSAGDTYYVRAYATNSAGTAYGENLILTVPVLPSVTTQSVTNIGGISATCSGMVTFDGYEEILARGICWDTLPNPTLSANFTTDGMGIGIFSHSITDLIPNTTYYVRAYATNKVGTSYGNEVTFTTVAIPEITTEVPNMITYNSAWTGGSNIQDNGFPITEKGICWSEQPHPDINGQHSVADGTGTYPFAYQLTGLTQGFRYYVRAYATNSQGTAYGQEVTFIARNDANPCPGDTTVTDFDGNIYHTVQIGEQCWLKENLRSTHYVDGSYFSNSSYPDNDSANVPIYGLMYSWETAMNGAASSETPGAVQGICPNGWHLPSYSEFQTLKNYCEATYSCVSKALASTSGWHYTNLSGCYPSYNSQLNNQSGFSAYPTGSLDSHPVLSGISYSTAFWSSTLHHSDSFSTCSYTPVLMYIESDFYITWSPISGHLPVRCVRNE